MEKQTYLHSDFFGFFTKYSLLGNYGFLSGLWSRLMYKVFPEYVNKKSFEYFILSNYNKKSKFKSVATYIDFNKIDYQELEEDLNFSIIALASKITSVGLDKNIKYKLEALSLDVGLFSTLSKSCTQLNAEKQENIIATIEKISLIFDEFRRQKNKFGTSIQLTYKTSLVKKYINRLSLLVSVYYNNKNVEAWDKLTAEYIEEYYNHKSVFKYIKYHFDLVLLQVVEHTSKKGEKYIAENRKEYGTFFKKSMIAGTVICVFALIKLYLDGKGMPRMSNAFLFSINYALCFIMATKVGGIIATKQPAMTASTISKIVDQNNNRKIDNASEVIEIIKKTSRSQFISFVGNVIIALPGALIIFYLLSQFLDLNLIDPYKSASLKNDTSILNIINLYYAAIAGLFLSLSGFISGYIDNKMIFTKVKNRIQDSKFLNRFLSPTSLGKFSVYIENKSGATLGNISLGFLLGSCFLLGDLLHIPFDIRHIAFSASYLGVLLADGGLGFLDFTYGFLGVAMIGFINFLVSFSLTLFITLKTRGITTLQLTKVFIGVTKDLFTRPLSFIYFNK